MAWFRHRWRCAGSRRAARASRWRARALTHTHTLTHTLTHTHTLTLTPTLTQPNPHPNPNQVASQSAAHFAEDLSLFEWQLDREDMARLEGINTQRGTTIR